MNYIICEMPLGLSLTEILLHLLNFAILMAGMYFLLFKPVKKGMEKRKAKYSERETETAQKLAEADELKKNYEDKVKSAGALVDEEMTKARATIKTQADKLIVEAEIKAKEIIARGRKSAEEEIVLAKSSLEGEIANISLSIAGSLLKKEINKSSNDKLIEETLEAWLTGGENA